MRIPVDGLCSGRAELERDERPNGPEASMNAPLGAPRGSRRRGQSLATARTLTVAEMQRAGRLCGAGEAKHGKVAVAVELGDGEDRDERDGRRPRASSGVDLIGRLLT